MATTSGLEQLAEEKEQELLLIRQQQAQAVQETLKGVQNELVLERQRLSQLQADFDYNLGLLSQRDDELAHYEKAFAELKRVINNLLAENSELKVRMDGLHTELEQSRQSQQQLKAHYVKRVEELHTQTEAYRHATQSEVERERGKLEELQRQLEQRLLEVEGDIQCQRNHISAEFDQLSRQREHEHQIKVSELNSQLLSKEGQVKQLEREIKMAQTARASSEEQARGKESEVARMEREMRELEWKMEDTSSCLESRVAELQAQLEQTQAMARAHQEDFQKRHDELDRKVREKEACIKAAREAHNKREGELELLVTELRAQLEGRESEMRREIWEHEDTLKEKELQIQRCREDLASCQSSHDDRIRGMSQELVARDLKLQTLEDMCDKLRDDVRKRDSDIERFKQEVSAGLEREKSLEQSKAQLQLDWEGRMEEVERKAYGKHQDIIQQLTQAKDKLSLECEELRSALEERSGVLTATQQERDIAIATLNKHGLASQVTDHVTDHMTQLQHLRQQNEELHTVIRQMRQEIEQLAETSNGSKPHPIPSQEDRSMLPTAGYIQYMENELIKIKSENRQLLERIQQAPPTGKPPTPLLASPGRGGGSSPGSPRTAGAGASSAGERRQHRGHLIALSDTIAGLQREKGALELAVVQLRGKVEELETSLSREQEQVYLLKACQVPQSKLHLKLLQATKVIIALVKEKKQLTAQLKEVSASLDRRKTPPISKPSSSAAAVQQRVQQCDKCIQTARDSPRNHVQWTSQKSLESSIYQGSRMGQPDSKATPPSLRNKPKVTPLSPKNAIHDHQTHHSIHKPSGHIQSQQNEQQLDVDVSLTSLKFTDSSLGESSLHQVLQMVERELSSSDNDRDVPTAGTVRHSTPEPPADHQPSPPPPQLQEFCKDNDGRSLELVGSKVVPRVHTQSKKNRQPRTMTLTSRSRTQNRGTVQPRVRNYNIRD